MKKLIGLFLLSIVLFSGCAFFQGQKANFDACLADVECKEMAEKWQSRAEVAGELVATGAATIVPGAAIAIRPVSKISGYLGLIIAALIGGAALTKKKKESETEIHVPV